MCKKLTVTQQCLSSVEKECYAIVKAIEQRHRYLQSQHFILQSDHKTLEA